MNSAEKMDCFPCLHIFLMKISKLISKELLKNFLITKNRKVVTQATLNEAKTWSNLTLQMKK